VRQVVVGAGERTTPRRIPSLDGLRGVAALVVVVHHTLLVTPLFSGAYFGDSARGVAWWMTHTPLHLLWAGDEAVLVFFVLSGLVLTLPVVRSARRGWVAYYVRRLPRLYLPVWGSLVLAAGLALAVPRVAVPGTSILDMATDPTPRGMLRDAFLLVDVTGLNGPLWSLRYEVFFSLLLPLYVWVAVRARRLSPLLAVLALAASTAGVRLDSGLCTYLPVFALGVLLGVEWDRCERWALRLGSWWWSLLAVLAGLCLVNSWLVPNPLSLPLTLVGACLAVAAFAWWAPARRFGTTTVVRHLGRLSFSLYLVHWPLVVTVTLLLGLETNPVLLLVVCTLVSLLVAEVFHRLVEGPSHRLAQALGRRVAVRQAVGAPA